MKKITAMLCSFILLMSILACSDGIRGMSNTTDPRPSVIPSATPLAKDDFFVFSGGRKVRSPEGEELWGFVFSNDDDPTALETKRRLRIGDSMERLKEAYYGEPCLAIEGGQVGEEFDPSLMGYYYDEVGEVLLGSGTGVVMFLWGSKEGRSVEASDIVKFTVAASEGQVDDTVDEVGSLVLRFTEGEVSDIEVSVAINDPSPVATPPISSTTPTPASATPSATPDVVRETVSQRNAVRKADQYLEVTAFSREGLIEQLEYGGFSREDSEYAVDKLHVDWMEQASKKAKQYLEVSAFSRKGLIEQLEYTGFTREQAEYGATSVGF